MRIVLLLLLLAWSGHASAETVATCKGHIDALPAVIDTPGIWCVDHDLATSVASGAAISVTAHNVTIDCNGFRLGGLPAGPNTLAAGIRADDVLNLTVRNCAIRGFAIGIWTAGGGGHLVTRNRIDGSTLGGIIVGTGRTDGTGVSDGSAVRDNQIWNTGGRFTAAIGIHTWGTVDIVGNTVSNVTALAGTSGTPEATGIDINDNPGTLVERNIVRGLVSSGGYSYAMRLSSDSGRVYFKDNDLMGRSSEANGYGIRCDGGESPALLHGNTLLNFPSPWTGCVDGGNNSQVLP